MTEVNKANTKEEFLSCWELIHLLYPNLDQESYLVLILYMMDENYKLLFIKNGNKVVAICGYRYQTALHARRSIHIDHLCTLPEVSKKGYATTLLKTVMEEAIEAECQTITFNNDNQHHDTLPFFLNYGFKLAAFHLVLKLNPPD